MVKNYEKIYTFQENYNKFNLQRFVTKFVVKNASEVPEETLLQAIQEIIDESIRLSETRGIMGKVYKIALVLNGSGLETPIVIPLRSLEFNTAEFVLAEIDLLEVCI